FPFANGSGRDRMGFAREHARSPIRRKACAAFYVDREGGRARCCARHWETFSSIVTFLLLGAAILSTVSARLTRLWSNWTAWGHSQPRAHGPTITSRAISPRSRGSLTK